MNEKYESIFENETISLFKGINARAHEGFWLYDATRGMNLSMRAPSERQAFVNAIMYYQSRLTEIEKEYKSLRGFVDNFVEKIQYWREQND